MRACTNTRIKRFHSSLISNKVLIDHAQKTCPNCVHGNTPLFFSTLQSIRTLVAEYIAHTIQHVIQSTFCWSCILNVQVINLLHILL